MQVRIWGRPEPTEADADRVLHWPEEPEPQSVPWAERQALPADARVPGCRVDPSTNLLHVGWYGRDTSSHPSGPRGVWYRSLPDAVLARRWQILRRAVTELTYLEAFADNETRKTQDP
jgi:hypothetical protein